MAKKPIDLAAFVADLESIGWRVYDRTDIPEVMLRFDCQDGTVHWWSKIHATPMSISAADFIDSKFLKTDVQQMSVSLDAPHWLAAQVIIAGHVSPVAATVGLYRRCPVCWTGESWSRQCRTCNGIGFVPVTAPAPPVGLLTAARAVIAEYDKRNCYSIRDANVNPRVWETEIGNLRDALRREVEAAPAATPVALTAEEREQFADEIVRLLVSDLGKPDPYVIAEERVDGIFAKLDELGFELRRK